MAEHSQNMLVRITPVLKRRLLAAAKRHDITLSQMVRDVLQGWLESGAVRFRPSCKRTQP